MRYSKFKAELREKIERQEFRNKLINSALHGAISFYGINTKVTPAFLSDLVIEQVDTLIAALEEKNNE